MADKLTIPFRGRGKVNTVQTTLADGHGNDTPLAMTLTEASILTGSTLDIEDAGGLKYAGTAITSTAAELNILDGVTSTAAELNILDGVTATAAELNILDTVTATAGELNILDDTVEDVTIAYAASATTDGIEATLTVVDAAAVAIDAVHKLEVFITDDDIGGVLTSTAASGALTAATGAILTALTAKKHVTVTTDATGVAVLLLVDSANTAGERFCVVNPVNGKVIVGAETVAGDYEGG